MHVQLMLICCKFFQGRHFCFACLVDVQLKCIAFNGWVIFHCVYVPQLFYPFICWWASRLLPCPGYYKQCCDEHWSTRVSFSLVFFKKILPFYLFCCSVTKLSQLSATSGLQRTRLPCLSLSPGICSNLSPLIESVLSSHHVASFSSCPQSFLASRSFSKS